MRKKHYYVRELAVCSPRKLFVRSASLMRTGNGRSACGQSHRRECKVMLHVQAARFLQVFLAILSSLLVLNGCSRTTETARTFFWKYWVHAGHICSHSRRFCEKGHFSIKNCYRPHSVFAFRDSFEPNWYSRNTLVSIQKQEERGETLHVARAVRWLKCSIRKQAAFRSVFDHLWRVESTLINKSLIGLCIFWGVELISKQTEVWWLWQPILSLVLKNCLTRFLWVQWDRCIYPQELHSKAI